MLKAIVNSPVRSGDQTILNGDLVVGTAGEGINFNANTPAAGMTSQLLNWYEEGTWTPSVTVNSGTATSYTIERSVYTRIGRQVTVKTEIIPIGGTFGDGTGYCSVTGLPFQPSGNFIGSMGNTANYIKGEWSYAGTNSANLNIDIGAGITITVGNRATLQVTYFV